MLNSWVSNKTLWKHWTKAQIFCFNHVIWSTHIILKIFNTTDIRIFIKVPFNICYLMESRYCWNECLHEKKNLYCIYKLRLTLYYIIDFLNKLHLYYNLNSVDKYKTVLMITLSYRTARLRVCHLNKLLFTAFVRNTFTTILENGWTSTMFWHASY